jgi:hypothetical protein
MVHFNELRVTSDGKKLIIDISVKNLTFYKDIYLDSITIDTQDTYKDNGPSSTPIYTQTITDSEDSTKLLKDFRVELTKADFSNIDISNTMFMVYIKVKGNTTACTPCGMDNIYTLGVTFCTCNVSNIMMQYIREVENNCQIPKEFIDMFLKFKAMQLSINTEHYAQGIKYYNKFFKDIGNSLSSNSCKCYD